MASARLTHPPCVRFPGGYVQIMNPRYPVKSVWSDFLFLERDASLPSHKHECSGSLLICVGGQGEIRVDGVATHLQKGVCVFIPAGAWHAVAAGRDSKLECISVNEGIIEPGAGVDMTLDQADTAVAGFDLASFSKACASEAEALRNRLLDTPPTAIRMRFGACNKLASSVAERDLEP